MVGSELKFETVTGRGNVPPTAAKARGPHLVVGRWGARFRGRAFPCAVGRGGIGDKRREGDGITPHGVHRIEAVLRRGPAAVAACLPHARIGPFDGWSDDPADPAYNGPVRRPHPHSHEALHRPDRLYDLVGVLDWNRATATAGRGSAIFLHVWRKPRHPPPAASPSPRAISPGSSPAGPRAAG